MNMTELIEVLRRRLAKKIRDGELSGSELARRVGVAQAHVSNFLHVQRGVSVDLANRLLSAVDLEVEDLIADSKLHNPLFVDDGSQDFTSVRVVTAAHALTAQIRDRHVLSQVKISAKAARNRKTAPGRESWHRFVAIADQDGRIIVLDRYDTMPSLGLFATERNGAIEVGRVVSIGRKVIFCPSSHQADVHHFPQIIGRVLEIHERICN